MGAQAAKLKRPTKAQRLATIAAKKVVGAFTGRPYGQEWWRPLARQRAAERQRLSAWLDLQHKGFFEVATRLWPNSQPMFVAKKVRRMPGSPYAGVRTVRRIVLVSKQVITGGGESPYARYYRGYLVVWKRAPRWLRNWARADVGCHTIETWQPLTEKTCKVCVDFAKLQAAGVAIVGRLAR